MMNNMKQELKCFVCGGNLNNTQQKECPKCKNVLGVSVNTLEVISIGDMLFKQQLSEDRLAFAFDFDFNTGLDCFKNMQFNKMPKPFIGIDATINTSGVAGFGGARAVAVFYGEHELDVQLNEEQTKYIADKIMPFIIACAKGFDIDELDIDFELDDLDELDIEKLDDNSDINPTFEENLKSNNNVFEPKDLADALYSITSDDFKISLDMWDSLPVFVKTYIGKDIQKNPNLLVDLVNYTVYNYKNEKFDALQNVAELLIENHIESFNKAIESVGRLVVPSSNEDEYHFLNKELEETLIENDVTYNTYDAFEASDFSYEYTMFSLLNDNNEECIHIVVLDDGYRAFENIRELKENRIFDLNDPKSVSLELDEILALVSKMGLIKENFNDVSEGDTEDKLVFGNSNDLNSNVSEQNGELYNEEIIDGLTLNLDRQTLLKGIKLLSDDDLLNELKRRMSSK